MCVHARSGQRMKLIALLLEKICDYRQMNQALLFMQMLGMLTLVCQTRYQVNCLFGPSPSNSLMA